MRRYILQSSVLLSLLVLLTRPAVVQGQWNSYTNNYGIWYYTTGNGTITITEYTGPGGVVIVPDRIPDTTNGLPVTSIGNQAFEGCGLTSITIPTNVTSIGSRAFWGCNLTSITIPNSVTSIGDGAFYDCFSLTDITIGDGVTSISEPMFYDCRSLTNVTIGSGVTSISNDAFSGCMMLKTITVDSLNSVYSSVDGVLFDKTQTTLILCPHYRWGTYTIPNSVTSIGYQAFYDTGLTSVTIGKGVTSIGGAAFEACGNLTSVTIPASVTSIGAYAFADCLSLTRVNFQGNAPSLGSYVFYYDESTIPPDKYVWDPATIYYLPGTVGWGATFGGRPTALLFLPQPLVLNSSVGIQSNQFGFMIFWATNSSVVIEATRDLSQPLWSALNTNTLINGSCYFSDPLWTNYPARFFRIRSL